MSVDLTAVAAVSSLQPVENSSSTTTTTTTTSNGATSKQNLLHSIEKLYAYFGEHHVGWSLPLKICAIDCEMCSTEDGLELTRVSIFCPKHGIIIDALVSSKNPLLFMVL